MQKPSNSEQLVGKAVAATIAAIEVYNKPDFRYREEAFSILMVNAWELLLKAKYVAVNGEDMACLYVRHRQNGEVRLNRVGNPMTHDILFVMRKLTEVFLTGQCQANIEALVEIRDNAIHIINTDAALAKKVQEVGMASLANFMDLATKWFGIDFSRYEFFLMPMAFFRSADAANGIMLSNTAPSVRLVEYIDKLARDSDHEGLIHQVTLPIEIGMTKRSAAALGAVEYRITNDPDAPALRITEEDILRKYPYSYKKLTDSLRGRYSDFKENHRYHNIRRSLEGNSKYCYARPYNPTSPSSSSQKFYSSEVFKIFDCKYSKK